MLMAVASALRAQGPDPMDQNTTPSAIGRSIRRLVWTINAVAALEDGRAIAARAGARLPEALP
ncbi:MAG TPA: hypothetical protein VFH78_12825 [Candidatus Thermoplasmatota archaeon]|nr:hypothetical protein [Candidatus Thermoplasmatota archaeon]